MAGPITSPLSPELLMKTIHQLKKVSVWDPYLNSFSSEEITPFMLSVVLHIQQYYSGSSGNEVSETANDCQPLRYIWAKQQAMW